MSTNLSPVQQSVAQTIIYHSIFNAPITLVELKKYLIGSSCTNLQTLHQTAQTIPFVEISNGYYFLKDNNNTTSICQNHNHSWQLVNQACYDLLTIVPAITPVTMIAISGSTAALNADQQSDIDLTLISPAETDWQTRLQTILFMTLGQKRVNLKKTPADNAGKLCLNQIFNDIQLVNPQDLYSAMEIAHLKVIFNRNHTYQNFLIKNSWVENYLPNFWSLSCSNWQINPSRTSPTQTRPSKKWLNQLAKIMQQTYYQLRNKRNLNNLHQHWEFDYREEIMTKYRKKLAEFELAL